MLTPHSQHHENDMSMNGTQVVECLTKPLLPHCVTTRARGLGARGVAEQASSPTTLSAEHVLAEQVLASKAGPSGGAPVRQATHALARGDCVATLVLNQLAAFSVVYPDAISHHLPVLWCKGCALWCAHLLMPCMNTFMQARSCGLSIADSPPHADRDHLDTSLGRVSSILMHCH